MAKYLYAYRGGGMAETEEAQQAVMAAWGKWFEELGPAIVDGGNPFGPSATVKPGGATEPHGGAGLSGYSIVSADSLEAAAKMAVGCPVLTDGGSVEVYETFDVM